MKNKHIKFTIVTASLVLLMSVMGEKEIIAKTNDYKQIKEVQEYISPIKDEPFSVLIKEYKLEQFNVEKLRSIEQAKLEQERIEIERNEQRQINFFQIIQNHNVKNVDLRISSGLTIEQADLILAGTGLAGLGKGFVEAEIKNGVNAYYLMAHAAWESSWGKSDIAMNKNNLFGFTAYDASPGLSSTSFSSKEEGIDIVAAYVKKHYLSENGKYNHGSDLQGMNVRYASDQNWSNGIGSIIEGLVDKSIDLTNL